MRTVQLHRNESGRLAFFHFALRMVAGLVLLLKGLYFISNSYELQQMIAETNAGIGTRFMIGYITFAHLIGGAFILLGLLTRVAVILQLPIVLGALFYNLGPNTFGTGAELILSIALLIMLVYIFVQGPGKISMDHYLKEHLL
jgi:putative oxidoreductase